jgi:hypothetical protein
MASIDPALQDPLLALRRAIAAGSLPTPTTSSELSDENATEDLAKATHLYFRQPIPQTIALTAPTRFVSASSDSAVDLRSIFFAWQKKDVAIPEYIASAQELNESLKQKERKEGEPEEKVQNLVFVERLDLITWLEGASDESEYIKPLEGAAAAVPSAAPVDVSAAIAPAAVPGAQAAVAAPGGRAPKPIDPRLQEIYNGERKMGDRNSVLRGIKPTVSSTPAACKRINEWQVLTVNLGFLTCPQSSRDLPRTQPLTNRTISPRREARKQAAARRARAVRRTHPAAKERQLQEPRSHYPPLTLRLVSHPHDQRPLLPTGRRLRASRPPDPRHAQLLQQPPLHLPAPPLRGRLHLHLPSSRGFPARSTVQETHALHPRRQHRQLPPRLLEPPRRRVHDGPDLAIQVVQVDLPAGTLQARHRHLRRLAWGRRPPRSPRLGPRRAELCRRALGRERRRPRRRPLARSRSRREYLDGYRRGHESERMGSRVDEMMDWDPNPWFLVLNLNPN